MCLEQCGTQTVVIQLPWDVRMLRVSSVFGSESADKFPAVLDRV